MHGREEVEVLRADEERYPAGARLQGDLVLDEIVLQLDHRKGPVVDAAGPGAGQGDGQEVVVVDAGEVELPLVARPLRHVRRQGPIHVEVLRQPVLDGPAVQHRRRQLLKHEPRGIGADPPETRAPGHGRGLDAVRRRDRGVELQDVRLVRRRLEAERLPDPQARAVLVLESERLGFRAEPQAVGRRPEQGVVQTRRQIRSPRHDQREGPRPARRHLGQRQLDRVAVVVGIVLQLPAHELGAAVVELREHEVALHDDGALPVVRNDRDRGDRRRARRRRGIGGRGRRRPRRLDGRGAGGGCSRKPGAAGGLRDRFARHALDHGRGTDPLLVQHQDQEGQRDREKDSALHDRSDVRP